MARQNADYRLRQLEDEGMVRSKRVDNSLAWSLSEVNSDSNEVDPADDFWETETYEGASMSASAIDDGDNEAE